MLDCWQEDPGDRPNFTQLCNTIQSVIEYLNGTEEVDYANVFLSPKVLNEDTKNIEIEDTIEMANETE